jgi:hypothetical protein
MTTPNSARRGPHSDDTDIAAARAELAGQLAGQRAPAHAYAFLVGMLDTAIHMITQSHTHCRTAGCETCALLRHTNAYLRVFEEATTP